MSFVSNVGRIGASGAARLNSLNSLKALHMQHNLSRMHRPTCILAVITGGACGYSQSAPWIKLCGLLQQTAPR